MVTGSCETHLSTARSVALSLFAPRGLRLDLLDLSRLAAVREPVLLTRPRDHRRDGDVTALRLAVLATHTRLVHFRSRQRFALRTRRRVGGGEHQQVTAVAVFLTFGRTGREHVTHGQGEIT